MRSRPGQRAALVVAATTVIGLTVVAGSQVATPAGPAVAAPSCPAARTLPLRTVVAQTLMVGVSTPSRTELRSLLDGSAPVGGLFLQGDSAKVLRDGRLGVARTASIVPLLSADDEGGRVQRLAFDGDMPSAREQAKMTPRQVQELAHRRGTALRRYGITMNLAPVVDLGGQRQDAVIGDRAYAKDPATVVRYAGAFAAGMREAGVLPVIKHFPGHGRARGDSHSGSAITPPAGDLRARDWVPYRDLGGTGAAVMMGHLRVPKLSTPGLPASLDPRLYEVLRTELGFTGLAMTDELAHMQAVRDRFGLHEAVRRAIAAGADIALFLQRPAAIPRLLAALVRDVRAGRLFEDRVREAAGRVLQAKRACDR